MKNGKIEWEVIWNNKCYEKVINVKDIKVD